MTLLEYWVSSLASFAGYITNVRESLKAVRTREEAFAELLRQSRSLKPKADSADRKLNKMNPGDNDLRQQADMVRNLREQIRTLDAKIMDEKISLGGWKRVRARECMGALFCGLLECSATGAIVSTSGRGIIEYVPTEVSQPGLPQAHYSGHSHVEELLAEAERTLSKISSASEAGVSSGQRNRCIVYQRSLRWNPPIPQRVARRRHTWTPAFIS